MYKHTAQNQKAFKIMLGIPAQRHNATDLNMSAMERHFYDRQHEVSNSLLDYHKRILHFFSCFKMAAPCFDRKFSILWKNNMKIVFDATHSQESMPCQIQGQLRPWTVEWPPWFHWIFRMYIYVLHLYKWSHSQVIFRCSVRSPLQANVQCHNLLVFYAGWGWRIMRRPWQKSSQLWKVRAGHSGSHGFAAKCAICRYKEIGRASTLSWQTQRSYCGTGESYNEYHMHLKTDSM